MNIEKVIELKSIHKNLKILKINRVYMYDSFCQNLIPNIENLDKSYKFVKDNNLEFTLNTPFVTDFNINKLLKNVEYISKYEEDFELVFNDWGVFYEIRRLFPKIKLLLGRLLTKQKTDPRINNLLKNIDKANITKEVFSNMYEHFQSSIINDKIFQNYLIENRIERVEIEYLVWNMKINLPDNIKATIYYPYAHISTTRKCRLLNMTYSKCSKTCRDTKIQYNVDEEYPYIVIGNTIYYSIENIMTKTKLKEYQSINRIVFNDIDTYYKYIQSLNCHSNML